MKNRWDLNRLSRECGLEPPRIDRKMKVVFVEVGPPETG